MTSCSDRRAAVSRRPGRRTVAVLGMLAALAGSVCHGEGPTPAAGAKGFDGDLADSLVRRQVDFGPRVPGTAAHDQAL